MTTEAPGISGFESWRHSGVVLMDIQRISYLRVLIKASGQALDKMRKDQSCDKRDIQREKAILGATQRELRRLENRALDAEFDSLELLWP